MADEIKEPILSKGQQRVLDDILEGNSVFITGAGGVGKSFLIKHIKEKLETQGKMIGDKKVDKKVAITASTGIAAVNIGGNTIHSFTGLGINGDIESLSKVTGVQVGKARNYIGKYDCIVIDEVSMLTGDYIRMLDSWFRRIFADSRPFGGRQMIMCGDFLQLPSVITEDDYVRNKYAFQVDVWKENIEEHYLTKSFRQENKQLKYNLDSIRFGRSTGKVLEYFNSRVNVDLKDPNPVLLDPHKRVVSALNYKLLEKLQTKEWEYEAVWSGDDKWQQSLAKSVIAETLLYLKEGAEVLFIKNNPEEGYYNGMRGTVTKCTMNTVTVETLEGEIHELSPVVWERCDNNGKILATMNQIPLILGWSISIHKSQGMTLEYMQCDLSNCFEYGQAYVALSRMSTLEGLRLTRKISKDNIKTDPIVIQYYRDLINKMRDSQEK